MAGQVNIKKWWNESETLREEGVLELQITASTPVFGVYGIHWLPAESQDGAFQLVELW